MNQNDFMRQQQAAVERMREMSAKAVRDDNNRPMPPVPPFVKLQGRAEPAPAPEPRPIPKPPSRPHRESGPLIPKLLESFKTDGDLPLILGLLLLLIGEGADKKLLFALIYILL